ncbi:glycerophosphodiester phosphodiesterase [Hymenobacter sp. BT175]|uniref:glycerophosphodiester phosphodiesterase family protein n=1 Tax=Hymenobacter translucens TaxID=2886507 RepID=UPI001D0F0B98|nr:glycerophosphodiester phosphodiesterase family protein [Hymenobacter translucens]MCC2545749.1 glycerophosphodiester phosphodiesterase [Hymenobacter translucens]
MERTNQPSRTEVHGHRGCRGLRPENTLPAFRHALELGVDVLEMDVVISADNQVVVSHEPWLSAVICRDAQGGSIDPATELKHNLYHLSYDVIRRCDCGCTRHPNFPEQVSGPAYKPLLSEVIDLAESFQLPAGRPPIRYSVELKSSPETADIFHPKPLEFFRQVYALLQGRGMAERCTLLSFDKQILQVARAEQPALRVCLLVEDDSLPLADHLRELGFVPNVFGPLFSLVSPPLLAQAHALDMQVVPWTVNEPADMLHLIRMGVDGLTTDYPDRLLKLLSRL